jgi:hypothetical protein
MRLKAADRADFLIAVDVCNRPNTNKTVANAVSHTASGSEPGDFKQSQNQKLMMYLTN